MSVTGTEKLYYKNMLLSRCQARVEAIREGRVILDKTIAFPEGGGQEGDRGQLTLPGGATLRFVDTTKGLGRTIFLNDFPTINVDTKIYHHIEPSDAAAMAEVREGDSVDVLIDTARRERLTVSHTASHILYMGIDLVRPGAVEGIIGCHIKEDSARFDLVAEERFSAAELASIETACNDLIASDYAIELYQHPSEAEAWYWRCNGVVIPCGGTHLATTGAVGKLELGRKNLGKGKERIRCAFPQARIDTSKYCA